MAHHPDLRLRFWQLRQEGFNLSMIARKLHLDRRTLQRWQKQGADYEPPRRNPIRLTARKIRGPAADRLVDFYRRNPTATLASAKSFLMIKCKLHASIVTISKFRRYGHRRQRNKRLYFGCGIYACTNCGVGDRANELGVQTGEKIRGLAAVKLLERFEENPALRLEEFRAFLLTNFKLDTTIATIGRFLR